MFLRNICRVFGAAVWLCFAKPLASRCLFQTSAACLVQRFGFALQSLGGETGIRTLGRRKPTTVFETAPFDHSGTSPLVFGS
jgi:hypothetical protein